MTTLLQICQRFAKRTGLPVPSAVAASTEPQVMQIAGLMDELLENLESRNALQQLTREATFTGVADPDQGSIHTIADTGFVRIIPNTFFNRTTHLRVRMGLSPSEWQHLQSGASVTGPSYAARIWQDHLYLSPEPAITETFAFEYQSKAAILASDNITYQTAWAADDDQWLLPDAIAISWLRYVWKREKGLDYAEEALVFETHVKNLQLRDNNPQPVSMTGPAQRMVAVPPEGNWDLP